MKFECFFYEIRYGDNVWDSHMPATEGTINLYPKTDQNQQMTSYNTGILKVCDVKIENVKYFPISTNKKSALEWIGSILVEFHMWKLFALAANFKCITFGKR